MGIFRNRKKKVDPFDAKLWATNFNFSCMFYDYLMRQRILEKNIEKAQKELCS